MDDTLLQKAHHLCRHNKSTLKISRVCGCFYCKKLFKYKDIKKWVNRKKDTALCPHCGIDSVIGDGTGWSVTKKFVKQMYRYWFSRTYKKTEVIDSKKSFRKE